MSPKLPRITAVAMLRALQKDGWQVIRQRGSHVILEHATKPGLVVVPNHRGDVRPGTLKSIMGDAGLTPEELRGLL